MATPTRSETIDTLVRHVGGAYGLSDDAAEHLRRELTTRHAVQAPARDLAAKVDLLHAEIAALRSLVLQLAGLRRPA